MRSRIIAAAVLLASSFAARADTFSFSFSGPSQSGSGDLTAIATATSGQYLITGISGTTDGSAIASLLAPGSYPPDFPPENDNLLLFPSTDGDLDLNGVSFALADGDDVNLFYGFFDTGSTTLGPAYFSITGSTENVTELNSFTLTQLTPEPSSFLLLGTGMLGLAGALRRRLA